MKQGSRGAVLDNTMTGSLFGNLLDEKNCVKCRNGDIKINNFVTKNREMGQKDKRHGYKVFLLNEMFLTLS